MLTVFFWFGLVSVCLIDARKCSVNSKLQGGTHFWKGRDRGKKTEDNEISQLKLLSRLNNRKNSYKRDVLQDN